MSLRNFFSTCALGRRRTPLGPCTSRPIMLPGRPSALENETHHRRKCAGPARPRRGQGDATLFSRARPATGSKNRRRPVALIWCARRHRARGAPTTSTASHPPTIRRHLRVRGMQSRRQPDHPCARDHLRSLGKQKNARIYLPLGITTKSDFVFTHGVIPGSSPTRALGISSLRT